MNLWLNYGPGEVYSQLSIDALYNYLAFLYPEKELAVFESFEPGNAYYTFRYTDFEGLLSQMSALTKTQMLVASNFLGRGYHIQEKDRLEERIKKYFVAEDEYCGNAYKRRIFLEKSMKRIYNDRIEIKRREQ